MKPSRFRDPHAGAAVLLDPRQLAQLACNPMQRRHHRTVLVDRHQFQRPIDPNRAEDRCFLRTIRSGSTSMNRDKWVLAPSIVPDPNCAEDMVPAVTLRPCAPPAGRCYRRTTVCALASHQRLYDGALPFVAKAKPARQDDLRHQLLLGAATRLPPGRRRLMGRLQPADVYRLVAGRQGAFCTRAIASPR